MTLQNQPAFRLTEAEFEAAAEAARKMTDRYCGTCGEPEGSTYAKPCCTDDNMLED